MTLEEQLIRDEGLKLKPYRDTMGLLTIGVGRNLDHVGITREEATVLLKNDIQRSASDISRNIPWAYRLPLVHLDALINLTFNMGIMRLLGFRKMLAALEKGDYSTAARELLDSKYAVQVGDRARRLARQFVTGKMQ